MHDNSMSNSKMNSQVVNNLPDLNNDFYESCKYEEKKVGGVPMTEHES